MLQSCRKQPIVLGFWELGLRSGFNYKMNSVKRVKHFPCICFNKLKNGSSIDATLGGCRWVNLKLQPPVSGRSIWLVFSVSSAARHCCWAFIGLAKEPPYGNCPGKLEVLIHPVAEDKPCLCGVLFRKFDIGCVVGSYFTGCERLNIYLEGRGDIVMGLFGSFNIHFGLLLTF